MSTEAIRFYTGYKQYGKFSNYYVIKGGFSWRNHTFESAEHAFQFAKFYYNGASKDSLEYAQIIRDATTPNKARILGIQQIKGGYPWVKELNMIIDKYIKLGVKIDPNWNNLRYSIMKSILEQKFSQNTVCKNLLLSTGNKILIEHTPRDKYWGDGGDGSGENKLGEILMNVRKEILETETCNNTIVPVPVPHSRCNYLDIDRQKLIIVGARPIEDTLKSILDTGVTLFVNLEDHKSGDPFWYEPKLDTKVKVIRLPTPSGMPPKKKDALVATDKVLDAYKNKQKIYIHCNGGHGRAGTFAALVIGIMHDLDAFSAIAEIEKSRDTRQDISRNFVPTPETDKQVNFLKQILGLQEGHQLQDRSNKSWLYRIRSERKNKKGKVN